MSLLMLPIDTLELIFEWIPLESLTKLQQCGNRALYGRILVGKAVKKAFMEIKSHKIGYQTYAQPILFPRLKTISQLSALSLYPSIEYLHLDFSGHGVVLDTVEAILSLNLRELTLIVSNGWSLFVEPNGAVRSLQASFRRITSLIVRDMKPIDTRVSTDSVMDQIGRQMPRSLTRLHLGTFSHAPEGILERLPPYITDLLMINTAGRGIGRFVSGKDLTQVTFRQQSPVVAETLSSMPSTLATLSLLPLFLLPPFPAVITRVISSELLHMLPSSLTTLRIPLEKLLIPPDAISLPPLLTELDASGWHNITDEWMARLPSQLLTLKIGASAATDACFSLLPRKLTYLRSHIAIQSPSALSTLPPSITKFSHHRVSVSINELEEFFPKSVKVVRIMSRLPNFAGLDRGVEALTLGNPTNIDPNSFSNLPPGLKKLSFKNPIALVGELVGWNLPIGLTELIYNTGEHFNDLIASNLPPSLTKLHVGPECTVSTKSLSKLPKSLVYCFLYNIYLTEHTTSLIPNGLKSFKKDQSLVLGDLVDLATSLLPPKISTAPCVAWVCKATPEFCASLPQDLKSLTLRVSKKQISAAATRQWSLAVLEQSYSSLALEHPDCVSSLPPTLTKLVLSPHEDVTFPNTMRTELAHDWDARTLNKLPATLTDLEIFWSCISSSALWIHRLTSLTRLVLHGRQEISDKEETKAFHCIPKGMRDLQLPCIILEEQHFSKLPSSLTHLSCHSMYYTRKAVPTPKPSSSSSPTASTSSTAPSAFVFSMTSFSAQSKSEATFPSHIAPFELLPPFLTRLQLKQPETDLAGPCTILLQSRLPFVPKMSISRHSIPVRTPMEDWSDFILSRSEKTPPAVTEISLADFNLTDAFFSRLSPYVTKISLPESHLITTASISSWPESLTSIHLGSLLWSASDLKSRIPPDLKVFDWAFLSSLLKSKAPPTLKELSVDLEGANSSSDWLSCLPKDLEELDLPGHQNLSDASVKLLPSALKVLKLPAHRRLTSACISSLPRSITTLILPSLPVVEKTLSALPPTLTHLDLSNSIAMTGVGISMLPRGILHLNLASSCLPDSCIEHLPRSLRFLSIKQILLTGSLLSAFSEDTEVSLVSLIAEAESRFPTTLEVQPCLEWRIETPSSFFEHFENTRVRSINLPCENVEVFNTLTRAKPNVVYRMLSFLGSPVAATTIPIKWVGKTIAYKLLDPKPSPFFSDPSRSKEIKLLTAFWIISRHHMEEPIIRPPELKSFRCHYLYNLFSSALQSLPNNLTSLRLPHSRQLDIKCFSTLPKSLTDLALDLEDTQIWLQPKLVNDDGLQIPPLIGFLPPSLTKFSLGSTVYEGRDTADLHVPPPQDEPEQAFDEYSF
jgi:hypothetical protein